MQGKRKYMCLFSFFLQMMREKVKNRPRSFLGAGFRPRMPLVFWFVPWAPNSRAFLFSPIWLSRGWYRWVSVDGVDTRLIPTTFSCETYDARETWIEESDFLFWQETLFCKRKRKFVHTQTHVRFSCISCISACLTFLLQYTTLCVTFLLCATFCPHSWYTRTFQRVLTHTCTHTHTHTHTYSDESTKEPFHRFPFTPKHFFVPAPPPPPPPLIFYNICGNIYRLF